jgi:2-polyprenyl-6-methoxyphenol hydroxylase-like FAD-dependent oxidoreductase
LLAARVLSEQYARVTILERDALGEGREPRRGVPQGRHAHGLLASGARALQRLFPGFFDDVVAAGGKISDVATDCLWHNFGGFLNTGPSDLEGFLISRPTMEALIRRRVRALPNVTLLDLRDALGLAHENGRVVGVTHKAAATQEAAETTRADLVVDASGRGGRALFWLEDLGYPTPAEERVEVEIAYTTRQFRRRPGDLDGKEVVLIAANPANWRPAAMLPTEDGRWTVTLAGYFGDRAPEDLEGFRAFARSLPTPEIFDVIAEAEPIGEAATYAFKASQRRRYEKLKAFPEGYLVFGDGLASFNPVYGQGMSVAAAEALALQACLAEGVQNLSRRFFAAAATVIDTPWSIAVGADLAHPRVKGPRPAAVRFVNWYMEKLYRAGQSDARVAQAFLDVANLVAPPTALFHPAMVGRVARANMSAGARRRALSALPA